MRVLHISKTSDGGLWAAIQAGELVRAGVEVHAALPCLEGAAMDLWQRSGAVLHAVDLNFPLRRPWLLREVIRRAERLADLVRPDLLHSHFVSTTLTLRAAFGRNSTLPRLFQVPGPLHMEHGIYRHAEIASAGTADYWIASSRYTQDLYLRAGISAARVFLSYYALCHKYEKAPSDRQDITRCQSDFESPNGGLRARLGIPSAAFVVGNINMFYRPKRYLGQLRGVKAHEDVIDALRIVTAARANVYGVLVGGPWNHAQKYFERLRQRAQTAAPGRIFLPGPLASAAVLDAWKEFDCAVHVPLSENCGGVTEPLLMGVPVIAGRVGGLPEVVQNGVTGLTVPSSDPGSLASAIFAVMDDRQHHRDMARAGSDLVRRMFSPERTAAEIKNIYEFVLGKVSARPADFEAAADLPKETTCQDKGPHAACAQV